jgi:hypothetical protein
MLAVMLMLALSLPPAEVSAFAARVTQSLAGAMGSKGRVLLRVEDPGETGAAEQVASALRDALRQAGIEAASEGDLPWQLHIYLGRRNGLPLATARITNEWREAALLFAAFPVPVGAGSPAAGGPALVTSVRTLLASDLPVLDLEADAAGNLFVLCSDRLRLYDLNAPAYPMKAEIGIDTGSDRLRDPLVRLVARDSPRQLDMYSAAGKLAPAPPLPLDGYALKGIAAPAKLQWPHPWRATPATLQIIAGRNYFSSAAVPQIQGLAPVVGPLRAHWAVLDPAGRLFLADAELRPILGGGATAAGSFGGDVASLTLPCAGALVLAASSDVNPPRDRITVLRMENDALLPGTSVELDGAVRRLKTLPPSGELRRVLAVAQSESGWRIDEIEVRCPQ